MNNLIRALMALTTVLPISIPFAFLFSKSIFRTFGLDEVCGPVAGTAIAIVAIIFLNLLVGFCCVWLICFIADRSDKRTIKVLSVKPLGGDSLLVYLPYILPLFLIPTGDIDWLGWCLGGALLFVLAWSSMTIPFSPLLKVCGLSFYEASLADRRVITMLVPKHQEPLEVKIASRITDFCMFGKVSWKSPRFQ